CAHVDRGREAPARRRPQQRAGGADRRVQDEVGIAAVFEPGRRQHADDAARTAVHTDLAADERERAAGRRQLGGQRGVDDDHRRVVGRLSFAEEPAGGEIERLKLGEPRGPQDDAGPAAHPVEAHGGAPAEGPRHPPPSRHTRPPRPPSTSVPPSFRGTCARTAPASAAVKIGYSWAATHSPSRYTLVLGLIVTTCTEVWRRTCSRANDVSPSLTAIVAMSAAEPMRMPTTERTARHG